MNTISLAVGLDVHFKVDKKDKEGEIHAFSGDKAKVEVKEKVKVWPFTFIKKKFQWVPLKDLSVITMMETCKEGWEKQVEYLKGMASAAQEDWKRNKTLKQTVESKIKEAEDKYKELKASLNIHEKITNLPEGVWIEISNKWRHKGRWTVEVGKKKHGSKSFSGDSLAMAIQHAHQWAWEQEIEKVDD